MKSSITIFFLLLTSSLLGQKNQAITQLLDAYAQHNRLSGVALVQQDNQTVFAKAYGCANYEKSTLNEVNTIFNIGSISKQFTAAAILHLVQEGKIDLRLSINNYLGKYASKHWRKVTVHHLLSHSSGIPSLLQSEQGLDDVFPEERAISMKELISYFKDLKLLSKPGKKYSYNNSGYVLLAAMIEEVSGQSYGDFMQMMFERYGLKHTSHDIKEDTSLALPYYGYIEEQRQLAPKFDASWFIGAGSIYSTVTDLAKWNEVIHSDAFLNAALRELYFQKHEESGNGTYYAYGWQIMERQGKKYIHHDGTTFGYTCDLLYEPKSKTLSVILSNQTHESLYLLGKSEDFVRSTNMELMQIMQGKKKMTLPKLSTRNDKIQAGTYTFSNDYQIQISKENGTWKIHSNSFHPLLYGYEKSIELDSPTRKSAAKAVEGLTQKKFSKFTKECDGTMKVLSWLGVIRIGVNSIMKGMGRWQRSVIYHEENGTVYFRLFCENGAVDFFLSYSQQNKIQGIFDIQYIYENNQQLPETLATTPTKQGLYLNGFAYGEEDAQLIFEETKVLFKQFGRVIDEADLLVE